MSDTIEVLFSCDENDKQLSCSAWDFRTGTNLMNYKGGGCIQGQGLSLINSQYLLGANSTKPLLHVWPINGQEPLSNVRFVLPGRANALALSLDGHYLVAGIQESIYIWHLSTGDMLTTISKHYQPISCIRFTSDSSHFITAGKDGGVLVWNLTQVVGSNIDENHLPLYSFNDHGLSVTDIHVGTGGIRSYLYTVSLDRTCKVYDLSNGTLLLNIVFDVGLQSVIANTLETSIYLGTTDGRIFEIHNDAAPRTKEYHVDNEHTNQFVGHANGSAVNCLQLSLDGQTLVSGGQDHKICIWHIPSRQLLKVMSDKNPVVNLLLKLTNTAIFNPEHKQQMIFGGNLKRMINSSFDENQTINVFVSEEHSQDKSIERQWCGSGDRSSVVRGSDTNSAEQELQKMRPYVEHLKEKNQKLFKKSCEIILKYKGE